MQTIQPLRNNWKIDEQSGVHPSEQIKQRVDTESWYTQCKGYPIIKSEEIKGRAGNPARKV